MPLPEKHWQRTTLYLAGVVFAVGAFALTWVTGVVSIAGWAGRWAALLVIAVILTGFAVALVRQSAALRDATEKHALLEFAVSELGDNSERARVTLRLDVTNLGPSDTFEGHATPLDWPEAPSTDIPLSWSYEGRPIRLEVPRKRARKLALGEVMVGKQPLTGGLRVGVLPNAPRMQNMSTTNLRITLRSTTSDAEAWCVVRIAVTATGPTCEVVEQFPNRRPASL